MFDIPHRVAAAVPEARRLVALGALVGVALLATLAVFAFSSRAAGCTSTWNNPAGGSWATAGDWTPSGEPNSSTAVVCLPALSSGYTVTLAASVSVSSVDIGGASGSNAVTLDAEGTTGTNATLTMGANSTIEATGQLILDSTAGSSSGDAELSAPSTATLTNDGSIVSQVESTNNLNFLEANLTNASGATVEVKSGELRQDQATTTTNDGTWTVDSSVTPGFTITNPSASFVNAAGTVSNLGAITLSGASWSQSGGAESGAAVLLSGGSLSDTGAGSSGSFAVQNLVAVSGMIAAGERVTATGVTGVNGTINAASGLVNDGTVVLDSQGGSSSGYAELEGGPVTNNGTLDAQVESSNNLDFLEASLTNASTGTVEVKSGELRQDHATTTTNDGTWKVDSAVTPGFTITNGLASFVNGSGGTVSNLGKITSTGAAWSQSAGAETGNAVTLNGGTLSDGGTGASGSFDVVNSVAVSGTIAAGETVTATGITGTNAVISAASGLVNDGTIVLDSQSGSSSGYANLAGGPVTNDGTLDAQVESSNNFDYIEANLTNATAGTIQVISGKLLVDHATTTTNDGDVILDPGAQMNATNGSAIFNEQTDGTMTFEIASATSFGTLNLSGGVTFNLAGGAADPLLEGGYAPPVGTGFDVITGAHGAGTFTSVKNDFSGVYSNAGFIQLVRDPDSTTTSLGTSGTPSALGGAVTFTATLTSGPGGVGNPTGTVTFLDNGSSIGTGTVSTTAGATTATLTTSSLAAGTHPITASYAGDANYAASTSSPALSQVVHAAASTRPTTTSTALTSSANPSTVGQAVTYTATVSPTPGGGTVTFRDGGSAVSGCSAVSLSTTGTARCQVTYAAAGTHSITAAYSGAATFAASTSPALAQVAQAPAPVLEHSGNLLPVSGAVSIKLAHTRGFIRVTSLTNVPIGTVIDATHGRVTLVFALPNGKTETITLYGGEFRIASQNKANGLVTFVLVGPLHSALYNRVHAVMMSRSVLFSSPQAVLAGHHPKKVKTRSLWGTENSGNYTTQGTDGAATVRGTTWVTEDFTGYSRFYVAKGAVTVTDFRHHHRQIELKAGQCYQTSTPKHCTPTPYERSGG